MLGGTMYRIYLCWNNNKKQVASLYEYDSRWEWRCDKDSLPYDILDEDDFNVWFDYGDL